MSENRVLKAIAAQPWAIKSESLELILAIAQRQTSDMNAVLSKKAEYASAESTLKSRDGVAIISIFGPIFPRADAFSDISGATSVSSLALQFGEALVSPDIKSIVLHIDSPGGQVTGIHEFANQIYSARGKKPVVAYASSMCCSAAYWLASAADAIVADATAEIGSIGVIMAWEDDSEARKAKGLRDYEIVSSQSPNKRMDWTSEEGKQTLQTRVDTLADIFIADVARNRGKNLDAVQTNFGEGGTLFAQQAQAVGMIDRVGNLEGLIGELSSNIGLTFGGYKMPEEDKKKQEEVAKKALEDEETEEEAAEDEEETDETDEEESPAALRKTSFPRASEIIDLCILAGKDIGAARAYLHSSKTIAAIRKELINERATASQITHMQATNTAKTAKPEGTLAEMAKKRYAQKSEVR